ncbi:hypothetical protein D7W79_01840 [Corallococcus exercitus]|uniref:hypothetical protein n=1 Tax=Corallococcus exercitus TaxID=2316736 RepID=UPI000EA14449|nr:hypothetical protein [Corallococcus exercitus]RKG82657.1 hypothetical protein D7W79_01840 [Corallococcus exercitus]
MSFLSRWFGKRPSAEPEPIPVTSIDQEYAYIRSHPCRCGGVWQSLERSTKPGSEAALHLKLEVHEMHCGKCGARQTFRFLLDTSHPDYIRALQETEQELLGEPPATTAPPSTVPPGHRIERIPVPEDMEPDLSSVGDSVCVATLGHGSDKPVEELEDMLRALGPQAWDAQRPARLLHPGEPFSRIFAPANPHVRTVPRLLFWIFNTHSLSTWMAEPTRLQVLLRHLYRLEHATEPVTQFVCFEHNCGPRAAVMARLLAGLGLPVRALDPRLPLCLKVHRPEGIALIALTNDPLPLNGDVDVFLATVNAMRAEAEAQGDASRLLELEARERDYLAKVLQPLQAQVRPGPLLRAPRLHRLLKAVVARREPTDLQALDEALLGLAQPLLMLMRSDGKEVFSAKVPGVGTALRVHTDMLSLQMAVKDLGLAETDLRIVGVAVREVFDWGGRENLAVVLNVYLSRQATEVFWLPDAAKRMAQGQPTSAARLSGVH